MPSLVSIRRTQHAMNQTRLFWRITILIVVLALAGCTSIALEMDDVGAIRNEENVHAREETSPLSVLPTPEPVPTLDIASIALSPEAGYITGVLRVRKNGQFIPVPEVKIGLGEPLLNDEGVMRMITYDASTSPTTVTDEFGRFVFADVAPGRYGFILDTVMSQVLLRDPATGLPYFADIEKGKIVDMDTFDYEKLPLVGYTD